MNSTRTRSPQNETSWYNPNTMSPMRWPQLEDVRRHVYDVTLSRMSHSEMRPEAHFRSAMEDAEFAMKFYRDLDFANTIHGWLSNAHQVLIEKRIDDTRQIREQLADTEKHLEELRAALAASEERHSAELKAAMVHGKKQGLDEGAPIYERLMAELAAAQKHKNDIEERFNRLHATANGLHELLDAAIELLPKEPRRRFKTQLARIVPTIQPNPNA